MLRTQWDPFEDLRSAQDELRHQQMNNLFAHALGLHGRWQGAATDTSPAWAPALDIAERKDAYLVTVELPGIKLDDLTITLEDGLLTIQGERHVTNDAADQNFHRVERRYGSFRRAITLPAHVVADAVEASFEDGVLRSRAVAGCRRRGRAGCGLPHGVRLPGVSPSRDPSAVAFRSRPRTSP